VDGGGRITIEKGAARDLLQKIDEMFESTLGKLSEENKSYIKSKVMGPALAEIRELILDSRPPVLFLVGRSGHGKSSIINALANKRVAEVGDIKPTSPEAKPYLITFEDKFSAWSVIDSRGLFETTPPDGASNANPTEILRRDVQRFKPDILLHVVSAPEARNLEKDLGVVKDIASRMSREGLPVTPTLATLNKVDTLGNPKDWPPEVHAAKAGLIKECLDYMTYDVLRAVQPSYIDANTPLKGYATNDLVYPGVIPVCAIEGDIWNIDVLAGFIADRLPKSALLAFVQAQNRKWLLRKACDDLISRFSASAGVIGASPVPVPDMAILVPLQLLMIAVIGGLSCRPMSVDTAKEYLAAAGINLAVAFGARELARIAANMFGPAAAAAAAASVAAGVTFGIGKSAERYFFSGEIKPPEDLKPT
jgi:uncharacterized protein (DUF697 family)/predicted GTPase